MVKSDPFFRWSRLRVVRFMIVALKRQLDHETERLGHLDSNDFVRRRQWFEDRQSLLRAYIEEASMLSMTRRARRLNSRRMAA